MTGKKKNLIIICDEVTKECANFLLQLLSLSDDEEGEIVGVEDDTVDSEVLDYNKYNEMTFKSNQKFLFIGEKASINNANNILVKYDNYGMSYGWFANRAVMLVREDQMPDVFKFGDLKIDILGEIKNMDASTGFENNILKEISEFYDKVMATYDNSLNNFIPIFGLIKQVMNTVKRSELRSEMKKLLYKYLVIRLYYADINSFI